MTRKQTTFIPAHGNAGEHQGTPTRIYKLTWERLGRGHLPAGFECTIEARDGNEACEQIFRFIRNRKALSSSYFDVTMDEEPGNASRGMFYVEYGRFGRGTWEVLGTVNV